MIRTDSLSEFYIHLLKLPEQHKGTKEQNLAIQTIADRILEESAQVECNESDHDVIRKILSRYLKIKAEGGFTRRIGSSTTEAKIVRVLNQLGVLSSSPKLVKDEGEKYAGEIRLGKFHGKGRLIQSNQCYEGQFLGGYFQGDSSHLSDFLFVKLLSGEQDHVRVEYPMGIMAAYLKSKPQYEKYGNELESANAIYQDKESSMDRVWNQLSMGEPQLIYYGTRNHAIGLRFVPHFEKIELQIFNSGHGLDPSHDKRDVHSIAEYQTTLRAEIPKNEMTKERLQKILSAVELFTQPHFAYFRLQTIFPSFRVLSQNEPIWQKVQSDGNFALEWIFAYLKNMMGEDEFQVMRLQLLGDCIASIRRKSEEEGDENQALTEIIRKLESEREQTLQECS